MYFLLFYNFKENKTINESYFKYKKLIKHLNLESISKKIISKFFSQIRTKINDSMHKVWMTNLIATEPTINGKCFCENDESKIINNNNEVRLMLGI